MYYGLKGELGSFFILVFLWSFALTNNEVVMPLFGSFCQNSCAFINFYGFDDFGLFHDQADFGYFGFHAPFTVSAVLILVTLVFVVQIKGFFGN